MPLSHFETRNSLLTGEAVPTGMQSGKQMVQLTKSIFIQAVASCVSVESSSIVTIAYRKTSPQKLKKQSKLAKEFSHSPLTNTPRKAQGIYLQAIEDCDKKQCRLPMS